MAKTTRPPRARVRGATQQPPPEVPADGIKLTAEGTTIIDPQKLLELKQALLDKGISPQDWSKVQFVARNAPFNRRSQIPSA
jgi:hypothetical protein